MSSFWPDCSFTWWLHCSKRAVVENAFKRGRSSSQIHMVTVATRSNPVLNQIRRRQPLKNDEANTRTNTRSAYIWSLSTPLLAPTPCSCLKCELIRVSKKSQNCYRRKEKTAAGTRASLAANLKKVQVCQSKTGFRNVDHFEVGRWT